MVIAESHIAQLRTRVGELLAGNRVEVGEHRYTRPAPSIYEHQWLWDSCFHAIIYRWLDPQMAQDELSSLFVHQYSEGPDAGMVPHMAYWRGGGAQLWGRDDRSIITQPPLIAWAARLVHERYPDLAWLRTLYKPLVAYHEWFDRRRDPDGDHLVSLIHPWESGWDASLRWDAQMKLSADPSDDESRLARKDLVDQLRMLGCDAEAIAGAGLFHVESVDFNAIRLVDLESLSWMADAVGDAEGARRWSEKAVAIGAAIRARMMDGDRLYDLAGPEEVPVVERTAGELVALVCGTLPEPVVGALHNWMRSPDMWLTYPVPTSPRSAVLFRGDRYWRGNVWLNINWLIWSGLRRHGYVADAHILAERGLALVEAHDFHEYFHPENGTGYGSFPHSWSGIVLDMLLSDAN